MTPAIPPSTSMGSDAPTPPMSRPPTPKPAWRSRVRARKPSCANSGNALMENRNGLLVEFQIVEANGTAERRTAIEMLDQSLPGTSRITLGADKAYDNAGFLSAPPPG